MRDYMFQIEIRLISVNNIAFIGISVMEILCPK